MWLESLEHSGPGYGQDRASLRVNIADYAIVECAAAR
mgnify:CR=1 FL=1